MGSAELGGSSSSPSVKTVSQIIQGAGSSVEIRFSDGSSFFVRSQDVTHAVGDSLSERESETLAAKADIVPAKMKAADMLAMRDHSRYQLALKLRKRKFNHETIELALDELQKSGLIDDMRFAKAWVEERLRRHPESLDHLTRGLVQKGINREIAREAVTAVADEETEQRALEAAADKLSRKSSMNAEKFVRSLASRGFPASRIYQIKAKYYPDRGEF